VVFAKTVHLDVLHDHHAVGFLREHGAVDQALQVDAVAGGEEIDRLGDAFRRPQQALALRVLADFDQQLAYQ